MLQIIQLLPTHRFGKSKESGNQEAYENSSTFWISPKTIHNPRWF